MIALLAWAAGVIGWTAKVVVVCTALASPVLTLFMLPGMWLALLVAGAAEWATDGEELFSRTTLLGCLALAALGEAWEFGASSVRAKRAGARRRGALGALAGGFVGALVGTAMFPVVGTLVVGGVGALAGSFLLERTDGRSVAEALRVGRAAAAGQMLGVAGKLVLATAVALWLAAAALVP